MAAPRKILVWDPLGGNYPAGSDPWSGTAKQVEPATKFFTPRTRTPAQHVNWALAQYSGAIDELREAAAQNDDWITGSATLGATTDSGVGQMVWHPGHQAIFHLSQATAFSASPVTLFFSRTLGEDWTSFSTVTPVIAGPMAIGYGSGSKRFDILLVTGGTSFRRWDHATQSIVTVSPAGFNSGSGPRVIHSPTNGKTYILETNAPNSRLWSSAEDDLATWAVESTLATSSAGARLAEQNGLILILEYYGAARVRSNTSDVFTSANLAVAAGLNTNYYPAGCCGSSLLGRFFVLMKDFSGGEPNVAAVITSSDGVNWSILKTFPAFTSPNWRIAGGANSVSNLAFGTNLPFPQYDDALEMPEMIHVVNSTLYMFFYDGSNMRYTYTNDPLNLSGKWYFGGRRFIQPGANMFTSSTTHLAIATLGNRLGIRLAGGPLRYTQGTGPASNEFGTDI